jgi:hypothetical protein
MNRIHLNINHHKYKIMLREPNEYYLCVKEWHVASCPDNDCAAALLAFLMFFHRHKQTMAEYARITNDMLKAQGKAPIADETFWQFHTDDQLIKKLFFWKEETIKRAIIYLRDEKKFIKTDAPEYLKKIYKTGRTKWFLIQEKEIESFLKIYAGERSESEPDEAASVEGLKPMERNYSAASNRREIATRVFRFWMLLHGETVAIDEARRNRIIKRLKEGKTEFDLIQAVIGNKHNPWHSGDNPDKQTFHQIKHIFPNAEKVEFFQRIAQNLGWTEDKTIYEYETVLGIEFTGARRSKTTLEEKPEEAVLINNHVYHESAKMLKAMVVEERKTMEVCFKEFCNKSAELGFSVLELNDAGILSENIIQLLAEDGIVPESRKQKIQEFTKKFIRKLKGQDEDE